MVSGENIGSNQAKLLAKERQREEKHVKCIINGNRALQILNDALKTRGKVSHLQRHKCSHAHAHYRNRLTL